MAQEILSNVTVLSHNMFDEYCYNNCLDDSTVEKKTDDAFISIINTKACLKYFLKDNETKHWFNENHNNVLNLEFDDLTQDIEWKGHLFKAMSDEQAMDIINFVEKIMLEAKLMGDSFKRNFYIHCRAGVSRSAAIGKFLIDYYKDYFNGVLYNIPETYNRDVYSKLRKAYNKKHGYIL